MHSSLTRNNNEDFHLNGALALASWLGLDAAEDAEEPAEGDDALYAHDSWLDELACFSDDDDDDEADDDTSHGRCTGAGACWHRTGGGVEPRSSAALPVPSFTSCWRRLDITLSTIVWTSALLTATHPSFGLSLLVESLAAGAEPWAGGGKLVVAAAAASTLTRWRASARSLSH